MRASDFNINDQVKSDIDGATGVVTSVSLAFVYVRWDGEDGDFVESPGELSITVPAPDPQLSIPFTD